VFGSFTSGSAESDGSQPMKALTYFLSRDQLRWIVMAMCLPFRTIRAAAGLNE
jgi:hypothetical protein